MFEVLDVGGHQVFMFMLDNVATRAALGAGKDPANIEQFVFAFFSASKTLHLRAQVLTHDLTSPQLVV